MVSNRPDPREIGINLGRLSCGDYNNITDVGEVTVGHTTLIEGQKGLDPGKGPIRTGVTAIIPHQGNLFRKRLAGDVFVLNGAGALYGSVELREMGTLIGPIAITNTLNVGKVADATVEFMIRNNPDLGLEEDTFLPLVCECDDSFLNDIRGRHVKRDHVLKAFSSSSEGQIELGNVGAGTGMATFDFKGGIGSSSRISENGYTVGVLVCSNFGHRKNLTISGVPVGIELRDFCLPKERNDGSIVIVAATDAPLSNRQLRRVAKRCALGLAKTGSTSTNGSGDVILAFSTAKKIEYRPNEPVFHRRELSDYEIDSIFQATVEATEESIIRALFHAETMEGRDGNKLYALPVEKVKDIMQRYGRL